MLSNLTVGFFFGVGFAAWLFSRLMRSSGGNTKNALIVSATMGFFGMVLVATLLSIFF